jgi:hypothetical protein
MHKDNKQFNNHSFTAHIMHYHWFLNHNLVREKKLKTYLLNTDWTKDVWYSTTHKSLLTRNSWDKLIKVEVFVLRFGRIKKFFIVFNQEERERERERERWPNY